MNNVKTINDNAGIAPVKVDEPLIDLLEQCVEGEDLVNEHVAAGAGAEA